MIRLNRFIKQNEIDNDSFEGSKELFVYASVLSTSMIVVSAILAIGNLVHRLAFRAGNDFAVYDKYADVNLFSFGFELEIVDKATWLVSLFVAAVVLFFGSTQNGVYGFRVLASKNLYLAGILVMSASVLIVSPLYDNLVGVLWFGFGDQVFLVALIAMPIAYYLNLKDLESDWQVVVRNFLFALFLYN
jgi:hypothetical protein